VTRPVTAGHRDPTARIALSHGEQLREVLDALSDDEVEVLAAVIVLEWPLHRLADLRKEPAERTSQFLSRTLSKPRNPSRSQVLEALLPDGDMDLVGKSNALHKFVSTAAEN
jgi:hypothetical protein